MSGTQQLTVILKQGHQALKENIAAVQMVVHAYPQARSALRALEEVLLAHLGRQDQKFFERLNAFFRESRTDLKMLEFLVHDLKNLKLQTFIFYDNYSGTAPVPEARTLPRDFRQFTEDILNRIRIEEEYLIPLLNKSEGPT